MSRLGSIPEVTHKNLNQDKRNNGKLGSCHAENRFEWPWSPCPRISPGSPGDILVLLMQCSNNASCLGGDGIIGVNDGSLGQLWSMSHFSEQQLENFPKTWGALGSNEKRLHQESQNIKEEMKRQKPSANNMVSWRKTHGRNLQSTESIVKISRQPRGARTKDAIRFLLLFITANRRIH